MAASCISQCDIFTKPHLSITKVVLNDRFAASASTIVSASPTQRFSRTSTFNFCSNRERDAKERLKSGLLSRIEGDADERSSNTILKRNVKCEAHKRRGAELEDFSYDLYELLGVEKDAQAADIKRAYRWLQKKCHPDIAGARGHDMAILLNSAYDVLSDPNRRANYDATCAEKAEFAGYTGEALYSSWFGRPGEDRAVFVEETRCVGCLKCALIAPNTFAIESQYGRARAVGQWLDDEDMIKDAMRACPVDCISWVDKGLLPALEFIMSKQPRLLVGIDNYSYVGVRQENVFVGALRFLEKYAKREEGGSSSSQETATQREARMAAEQEIHMKAGRWWYDLMYKQGFSHFTLTNLWDPTSTRTSQGALIPLSSVRSTGNNQFADNNGSEYLHLDKDADLGPLLEAAKQRRRQGTTGSSKLRETHAVDKEEYWIPMEPISCPLPTYGTQKSSPVSKAPSAEWVFEPLGQWSSKVDLRGNIHAGLKNIISAVPVVVSVTAAVLFGMNGGSDVARSETDLITGPLSATITSSVAMHMVLTAVVWYMVGVVVCEGAVFMTSAFVALRGDKRED